MEAALHTVLYIEDNPANIKLVAQILGRRPHIQLLTAHTPELGIELALARRPELILLDINLPGMDGYQVLEVFKADARLKAIPVVAITANAMTRDIERGLAAGFVDYLTKPLDVGHFHRVVDACLESPPAQPHIPSGDDR
jgi:CheY-like chemotaxis protein